MKKNFNLKICSFILLAFGFTYSLQADNSGKSFQLGMMASGNVCWASNAVKPVYSNGIGIGYSIGVTGDWNIVKSKSNYFLSFDFLSSNMRTRTKLDAENAYRSKTDSIMYENINHTFKLTYIEVPISIKLKVNEIGYTTWFAQFGIAPSILYSTRARYKADRVGSGDQLSTEFYNNNSKRVEDQNQEFDSFRDDIRFYRIATFIGAGMEYRFSGNTAFVTSLRFNNGLSDILSDKIAKTHNNFLALQVGVIF